MSMKKKQILSKEEALKLHHKTLVIDSQQPPATNGFLFNNNMKIKLNEIAINNGANILRVHDVKENLFLIR